MISQDYFKLLTPSSLLRTPTNATAAEANGKGVGFLERASNCTPSQGLAHFLGTQGLPPWVPQGRRVPLSGVS